MNEFERSKGLFDQVVLAFQAAVPEDQEQALKAEKDGGTLESEVLRDRLLQLVPEDLRTEALKSVDGLTDEEAWKALSQLHRRNGVRESMHWLVTVFLAHPFWRPATDRAAKGKRDTKPAASP